MSELLIPSVGIRHNCGFAVAHSLHDVYSFILDLQHRGREVAGIAAIGDRIDVVKWRGEVSNFDLEDLSKMLPGHDYHTFFAHVRYATRGAKHKLLQDGHPHVKGGTIDDRVSHVIIHDCDAAIVHNGQIDEHHMQDVPLEHLRTSCDSERALHYLLSRGADAFLRTVPGSYTLAYACKGEEEVYVLRDRFGIKPGVLGMLDGKHVAASEDIALRKNGGELVEELEAGAIYELTADGKYRMTPVVHPTPRHCFFEWNYIADRDSVLAGISVSRLRAVLGEQLALEFNPPDARIVTYLPRCPKEAARSYARRTDKVFMPAFYKMRGTRAFMGSTAIERRESIAKNLYLLSSFLQATRDEEVVDVDDSTVRGNNARYARKLLMEQANVRKVWHANYTPPIGIIGADGKPRYCDMGVDMPENDNFIARGRTNDEIGALLGMPVHYLSTESMLEGFEKLGMKREHLCTFCIGGEHPLCGGCKT